MERKRILKGAVMQGYKEITLTDVARDAVMQLQENIKTIASNNAGTAFPTENLYDGMLCYRTDEGAYYSYNASGETWKSLNISLPVATKSVLGAVKVGSGLSITSAGVLSASSYTLPTASSGTLGGVKIGSNISISSGTISVPTASTSTAGVITVGSGLSVSAGVLSVSSAPTATKATQDGSGNVITSTYAPKASPTFTGTVTAPTVTVTTTLNIPGGKVWIA